jgi:hypothetical protein
MKRILKAVFNYFDSYSRARTATMFVNMGRHDLARAIMLKEDVRNS